MIFTLPLPDRGANHDVRAGTGSGLAPLGLEAQSLQAFLEHRRQFRQTFMIVAAGFNLHQSLERVYQCRVLARGGVEQLGIRRCNCRW